MDLTVIRTRQSLVRPSNSEQAPSTTLDLSFIDSLPVLRCNARTLHVFRHGPEDKAAHRVIREALSKALVPYYPLAGRLTYSRRGLLQINCSGEGVWFVEAYANSTLGVVDYFNDSSSIPFDILLPDPSSDADESSSPLVQIQVTQFECGGFVIGLVFCHSVCDGLGAAQFLNAVGELARGLECISIKPVWERGFFPQHPPSANAAAPPPIPDYRLEHTNVDISIDQINRLKRQFEESTNQSCSSFEIVAASFWKARTAAINLKHDTQLKLVFFANCRRLLNPPMPKGFYGNCFFPVSVTASCEFLKGATNADVVRLIQKAKSELPTEFSKYVKMKGNNYGKGEDPFASPLEYTTLFISEWGKLGFNQIDYGWGPPANVVPIQGSSIIPVGIVGLLPLPEKGIRLMTWCVEKIHRQPFVDQMIHLPETKNMEDGI